MIDLIDIVCSSCVIEAWGGRSLHMIASGRSLSRATAASTDAACQGVLCATILSMDCLRVAHDCAREGRSPERPRHRQMPHVKACYARRFCQWTVCAREGRSPERPRHRQMPHAKACYARRFCQLLGTKFRALYQRRKGRDLFDLYYVLTNADVDIDKILLCHEKYISFVSEQPSSYRQFIANMEEKMQNPEFTDDTTMILRPDLPYNPHEVYAIVREKLIERLPGRHYKVRDCHGVAAASSPAGGWSRVRLACG